MKSGSGDLDMKIKLDVDKVRDFTCKRLFTKINVFFFFTIKGLIDDITLVIPNSEPIPVVSTLKGKPYTEDNLQGILAALKGVTTENVNYAMGV